MTEFEPTGIYPAVPTAIDDDGSINYDAQQNHLDYLERNGVQGAVLAGCTGHAATLGDRPGEDFYDEHVEFVAKNTEATDLPIIAGDGMNSTAQTIELAQRIEEEADIEAHLMISPYQNCPPQDLNVRHYEEVASELDEPIIAYNVPGRTGRNLEPDTIMELADTPGVIGVKEASNDPEQIREIGRRLEEIGNEDFFFGSGDDARNHLVYDVGGSFAISVSGNIAPEETVEVWEKGYRNNDSEIAEQLNNDMDDIHEAMFQEGEKNPISVQYAVNQLGFDFGTPRMPLDREPREDEEFNNRTEIEDVMASHDLI
ncbi:MAG: dihydrodipicolinate synthase family protein [Nanohaloarchaea archaeon]|nr:dihydrodipicolinate synthase family protein [Candidatus Nanohaloarchaea archaeon]